MQRLFILFVLIFSGIPAMAENARALFAGGCFWCMQPPYDKTHGVIDTIVGYAGGNEETANYKAVSQHKTNHVEAIEVIYDPDVISYQEIVDIFWLNIDPTNAGGQFCDIGPQYRSVIFYKNAAEKKIALQTQKVLSKKFGLDIKTEISPRTTFFAAEDYHQDYYKKNPIRYKFYRYSCGRDAKLEKLYGARS